MIGSERLVSALRFSAADAWARIPRLCETHARRLGRMRREGVVVDEQEWLRTRDSGSQGVEVSFRGLPDLVAAQLLFRMYQRGMKHARTGRHGGLVRQGRCGPVSDERPRGPQPHWRPKRETLRVPAAVDTVLDRYREHAARLAAEALLPTV